MSYSRNPQHFIFQLPRSKETATGIYTKPDESSPQNHPVSLRSTLVVCIVLPFTSETSYYFFLQVFIQISVCITFTYHACYMPCPFNSTWLDYIYIIYIIITSGEGYNLWSSWVNIWSVLGPNIFLSSVSSNILSLCTSRNVRDQVSHPYRTTGKITVLYTVTYLGLWPKITGSGLDDSIY
jgi:hypothetical protein